MKHFTAILIAVSLIITMLSVSLVGAHTISDKSAANEAVGASNPAEEVGASNPAEEVGASRPADAAGATNPAEEAGATNPAEEVGASVPPQYNYDPINSINVRDAGKNYHLCGGGSAEMTKVTDRLYKYTFKDLVPNGNYSFHFCVNNNLADHPDLLHGTGLPPLEKDHRRDRTVRLRQHALRTECRGR